MSVAIVPPVESIRFALPPEPVLPLSVDQYHAMIRAGALESGAPIELLEGWLVNKMTKSPSHPLPLPRHAVAWMRSFPIRLVSATFKAHHHIGQRAGAGCLGDPRGSRDLRPRPPRPRRRRLTGRSRRHLPGPRPALETTHLRGGWDPGLLDRQSDRPAGRGLLATVRRRGTASTRSAGSIATVTRSRSSWTASRPAGSQSATCCPNAKQKPRCGV
jgi:hypothetical protein